MSRMSPSRSPSGGPVRTERGARNRGAIFNPGLSLFAEGGYDAAPMIQIAERARLSKAVIYDHFSPKAELYRALLDREAAALLDALAAAVPPAELSSPDRRLRAGLEAFFRHAEQEPVAWRLLI